MEDVQIFTQADLTRLFKLPKATVHYWRGKGQFPQPVKLGARKTGYLARDIAAWLEARKAA